MEARPRQLRCSGSLQACLLLKSVQSHKIAQKSTFALVYLARKAKASSLQDSAVKIYLQLVLKDELIQVMKDALKLEL